MALFQCKFFSRVLCRTVNVNVVIPFPEGEDPRMFPDCRYPEQGEKYQVLWLLHGFSGDEGDWLRYTSVERYAREKRLALVAPDASNSMYANGRYALKYYDYIVQELPQMIYKTFPISEKRENNFIAGMSMGGYGAFRAALTNPEKFAAAASLSGGLSMNLDIFTPPDGTITPVHSWRYEIFGEDQKYLDPQKDELDMLLKKRAAEGTELPRLYACCGTEDFMYANNIAFCDLAKELAVELTFEDGPGVHSYDFWDPFIQRVINWLPTKAGFVD